MSFIGRIFVVRHTRAEYKYVTYCGLCSGEQPEEDIPLTRYRGGWH